MNTLLKPPQVIPPRVGSTLRAGDKVISDYDPSKAVFTVVSISPDGGVKLRGQDGGIAHVPMETVRPADDITD